MAPSVLCHITQFSGMEPRVLIDKDWVITKPLLSFGRMSNPALPPSLANEWIGITGRSNEYDCRVKVGSAVLHSIHRGEQFLSIVRIARTGPCISRRIDAWRAV